SPPAWKETTPFFSVLVHSPAKQLSPFSGAYIRYSVSSIFPPEFETDISSSTHRVTVFRRFSQFSFLSSALSRKLPAVVLPPLPEKQYAGRFNNDFVEARRGDLERWINAVARHPLARTTEVLSFFLTCVEEEEWNTQLPRYLAGPPAAGPSFFSRVFYPNFNVDAEDAERLVNRFEKHTKLAAKGIDNIRTTFSRLRERGLETSMSLRAFSYSLLELITSTLPGTRDVQTEMDELEAAKLTGASEGLMTADGAWCWKDDCDECLDTTKGLQKLVDTLQIVADLHEDHARRTQLATLELLKTMAHPVELYAPTVDIHRSALAKYLEVSDEQHSKPIIHNTDPVVASRCEAVLNATMAELETYHQHKNEDFRQLSKDYLDGEIEFMEQVLTRFRTARRAFDAPPDPKVLFPGPRRPSIHEKDLSLPPSKRREVKPLTQPTPHMFDSSGGALKPVAKVLQEVGLLFRVGGSSGVYQ
ncbi:uncharacterized protein EI90DRAFT_3057450, partial [Cantharellus anzutake]|uniref:uncharacterized protein n=1 Tax=Cantharellus anzutake TaxID=1750568 RepID=UPI0019083C35